MYQNLRHERISISTINLDTKTIFNNLFYYNGFTKLLFIIHSKVKP